MTPQTEGIGSPDPQDSSRAPRSSSDLTWRRLPPSAMCQRVTHPSLSQGRNLYLILRSLCFRVLEAKSSLDHSLTCGSCCETGLVRFTLHNLIEPHSAARCSAVHFPPRPSAACEEEDKMVDELEEFDTFATRFKSSPLSVSWSIMLRFCIHLHVSWNFLIWLSWNLSAKSTFKA